MNSLHPVTGPGKAPGVMLPTQGIRSLNHSSDDGKSSDEDCHRMNSLHPVTGPGKASGVLLPNEGTRSLNHSSDDRKSSDEGCFA